MFLSLAILALVLVGCSGVIVEPSAQNVMKEQAADKNEQAAAMMTKTPTPAFNESLDRENIAQRLMKTNDPNMLQWIYPMSAGRVIGRFPVRGKVTSGSKRLTQPEQIMGRGGSLWQVEAPDEMGTYGSSGDYIFWFDPAGRYHQHQGDYFISPVPYKIDIGYGTISIEIDQAEEAKRGIYNQQTAQGGAGK